MLEPETIDLLFVVLAVLALSQSRKVSRTDYSTDKITQLCSFQLPSSFIHVSYERNMQREF